jgi:hypothetical protein
VLDTQVAAVGVIDAKVNAVLCLLPVNKKEEKSVNSHIVVPQWTFDSLADWQGEPSFRCFIMLVSIKSLQS